MVNWDLYRSVVGMSHTSQSEIVAQARQDFADNAKLNPAYAVATIGANEIGVLLRSSDDYNLKLFNAAYDCGIQVGDVLTISGGHFLCTALSNTDDVTLRGELRECNILLRFQLGSSTIIERYGYLDSGVYSTTVKESPSVQVGDVQYKLLLPYDTSTRRIQRDKRLATEVLYTSATDTILRCYAVTANDSVTSNYGNGRILELKLREDQYAPGKDSVAQMICDYIATTAPTGTTGGGWANA